MLGDGTLQEAGGHDRCGRFDYDAVKGLVAPKYRAYERTRERQTAVKIAPVSAA
ncbi:hypothetical protein [Streptomyces coeruleorubidus]|uniref:hypothetical protein n=1 Tax=Streptomyces coeruleorubidus TaxID=116188 RepID=UPI00378FA9EF